MDPEERDDPMAFSGVQDVQILCHFVHDYFPDLKSKPAIIERCMYTVRGRGWGQIDLVLARLDYI